MGFLLNGGAEIFISAVFLILAATIVISIVKGLQTWKKNNESQAFRGGSGFGQARLSTYLSSAKCLSRHGDARVYHDYEHNLLCVFSV